MRAIVTCVQQSIRSSMCSATALRKSPERMPCEFVTFLQCCLFVVFLVGEVYSAAAHEIKIVTPSGLATVEGNDRFILPTFDVLRSQQVNLASSFASVPESHRWITGFDIRTDESISFSFTGTTMIEMRLSTTPVASLDLTFDLNVGPDETVVFNGLWTYTSSSSGPPGGPHPFESTLTFQTPFFYDPAQGNLLVELSYDGVVFDTVDDVYNDSHNFDDGSNRFIASFAEDTVTAEFSTAQVDIIEFTFIPEPSSLIIAALGAIGLLAFGWRRRG